MITDITHTDTNGYTHTSADSYLKNGGVHQIQEYPTLFWFKDTTNVQQVFELLFQNIFGGSVTILRCKRFFMEKKNAERHTCQQHCD